jgi:hypothetical protein
MCIMYFDPMCCYCHKQIGNLGIFEDDLVFCSEVCYEAYKKMASEAPEHSTESL